MAIIGHVESTAITGTDSPVFEKAGLEVVRQVGAKQDAVQEQLANQAKQINELTAALTAFITAQGAPVAAEKAPVEKVVAPKVTKKAETTPEVI